MGIPGGSGGGGGTGAEDRAVAEEGCGAPQKRIAQAERGTFPRQPETLSATLMGVGPHGGG
jgi:hypothetical protein